MHELVENGLDPVYVLHSEHPILIERAVSAIRDAAVPPAARGFNYDVVEGKPKGNQIVSLCQTLPMMAQRRMVVVRDLGLMPADEADPVLGSLAKRNPSTVLVAVTSKLDKRLKLFAQLAKKGYLHVLEAPRQVGPWVRAEAEQKGVKMDAAAVSRLVETVGADLSRLSLAIEQLGLFAGNRPVRSDDVDELYRAIISNGGAMPLAVGTAAIASALGKSLGPSFEVKTAYRYGSPSVSAQLAAALQLGCTATVVPLFPQRTSSSSETIVELVTQTANSSPRAATRIVRVAPDDAGYIEAVADRVRAVGAFRHLVVSFHGIPRRYDRREGGRYRADCEATARALTAALGLGPNDATLCFQSRFGPEPWLGPATFDTLRSLAKRGIREVAVVMPGFVTEGLETLEEIGVRGQEAFCPALSAFPAFPLWS